MSCSVFSTYMKNFLVIVITLLLASNAFLLYKNYIGKNPAESSPIATSTAPADNIATSTDEIEGIVEDSDVVTIDSLTASVTPTVTKVSPSKVVTPKNNVVPKFDNRYQPFTLGATLVPNSPYIYIPREANKTVVLGDPLTIKWTASSTVREVYIDFFSTDSITARVPNDIRGIFAKSGSTIVTFDEQTPTGTFAFRICKASLEGEAHCQNAPYKITIVKPSISFIYPDEHISIGKNVNLGIRWKTVLPQIYKNNPVDVYLVRYTGRTVQVPAETVSALEAKYELATNIPNVGSYGFDIAKTFNQFKNVFGSVEGAVRVVPRVCVRDTAEAGVSRHIVCTGVIDGWIQPESYVEIKE